MPSGVLPPLIFQVYKYVLQVRDDEQKDVSKKQFLKNYENIEKYEKMREKRYKNPAGVREREGPQVCVFKDRPGESVRGGRAPHTTYSKK